MRDDKLPGFDWRYDFQMFVEEKGRHFEGAVIAKLGERWPITRIGSNPAHARSLAKEEATRAAIAARAPLIYQAVLWDEKERTFGMVDLLVRSDVLLQLFPSAFEGESEASIFILTPNFPSPLAGDRQGGGYHYRVVDIKFMTLQFGRAGHTSRYHTAGMVQCWIYNRALGAIQGYTPPFSYLLGRAWLQGDQRGTSCFDRLARIPQDDETLAGIAGKAVDWIRVLRKLGSGWDLFPPTRPELYPNMKNAQDFPWHHGKKTYAGQIGELTQLWRVTPRRRRLAHAAGITRLDDPRLTAAVLGFPDNKQGRTLDAILAANRRPDQPVVLPEKISGNDGNWRKPWPLELYVDFETVSDLADDFSRIPEKGGAPRIFLIGCGHLNQAGNWQFKQFTAADLSLDAERDMIDQWVAHLSSWGLPLSKIRLFHWAPAEESFLDNAYNSARARHPERKWPELRWFDLLQRLARREPVTVTGALNFGLKSMANAFFKLGKISTAWPDSRLDGLSAMVGAWRAAGEASERGVPFAETELIRQIGIYNEVDCRVMMEILRYLRQRH